MERAQFQQNWSATDYKTHAGFVPQYGLAVLDLLDPQPHETILDIGCGNGTLTEEIAKRCAQVIGVDSAPELLKAATSKGLHVYNMDAQKLEMYERFDAVFSNAAIHWMKDQNAVLKGARSVLKTGGRFVGELGGHGNIAAIQTALIASLEKEGIDGEERNPWVFPSEKAFRELLESNGFEVISLALIPRPTPLPTDIEGWLKTFANPFFDGLDGSTRSRVLANTVRLLKSCLCTEDGHWTADYVRLRFQAKAN